MDTDDVIIFKSGVCPDTAMFSFNSYTGALVCKGKDKAELEWYMESARGPCGLEKVYQSC